MDNNLITNILSYLMTSHSNSLNILDDKPVKNNNQTIIPVYTNDKLGGYYYKEVKGD